MPPKDSKTAASTEQTATAPLGAASASATVDFKSAPANAAAPAGGVGPTPVTVDTSLQTIQSLLTKPYFFNSDIKTEMAKKDLVVAVDKVWVRDYKTDKFTTVTLESLDAKNADQINFGANIKAKIWRLVSEDVRSPEIQYFLTETTQLQQEFKSNVNDKLNKAAGSVTKQIHELESKIVASEAQIKALEADILIKEKQIRDRGGVVPAQELSKVAEVKDHKKEVDKSRYEVLLTQINNFIAELEKHKAALGSNAFKFQWPDDDHYTYNPITKPCVIITQNYGVRLYEQDDIVALFTAQDDSVKDKVTRPFPLDSSIRLNKADVYVIDDLDKNMVSDFVAHANQLACELQQLVLAINQREKLEIEGLEKQTAKLQSNNNKQGQLEARLAALQSQAAALKKQNKKKKSKQAVVAASIATASTPVAAAVPPAIVTAKLPPATAPAEAIGVKVDQKKSDRPYLQVSDLTNDLITSIPKEAICEVIQFPDTLQNAIVIPGKVILLNQRGLPEPAIQLKNPLLGKPTGLPQATLGLSKRRFVTINGDHRLNTVELTSGAVKYTFPSQTFMPSMVRLNSVEILIKPFNENAYIWNIDNGKIAKQFPIGQFLHGPCVLSEKIVAFCGREGVGILNIETSEFQRVDLKKMGLRNPILNTGSLAFSKKYSSDEYLGLLATSSDRKNQSCVDVFQVSKDSKSINKISTFYVDMVHTITVMLVLPSGNIALLGSLNNSSDKCIVILNSETGAVITAQKTKYENMAWLSNGNLIAYSHVKSLQVFYLPEEHKAELAQSQAMGQTAAAGANGASAAAVPSVADLKAPDSKQQTAGEQFRKDARDEKISLEQFKKSIAANTDILDARGAKFKKTALYIAIEFKQFDKAHALLDAGAKINISCDDKKNQTALKLLINYVSKNENDETAKQLLTRMREMFALEVRAAVPVIDLGSMPAFLDMKVRGFNQQNSAAAPAGATAAVSPTAAAPSPKPNP